MREEIIQIVKKANKTKNPQVQVTYKKEATIYLPLFFKMDRENAIFINHVEMRVLTTVNAIDDWYDDKNRTITISFGSKFNLISFANNLQNALEKIEVIHSV